MKFATVATGGIGGYLAVKLTQAGEDVGCLARGAHLKAIREQGLYLGDQMARPRIATDRPEDIGPVDAVLFAVKAPAVEAAAEACKPLLGPETAVIPFLNGVETVERLLKVLPAENVCNGTAQISTTIVAPGVIGQVGEFANFTFAECDSSQSPRMQAIRAAFEGAGIKAPVVKDIDEALWRKFCMFAAMSGVTAAARTTVGTIRRDAHLSRVFRAAVAETARLARARGVALPEGIEGTIWKVFEGMPAEMRASTAIDVEAGRPLEVDWISGAVERLSEAAGLDAPVHRTLNAVLQPWKNGRAK